MIIDITRLKSGIDEYALIDLNYSFTKEQLENTTIIELNDVIIKGDLTTNNEGYHLNVDVKGTMILPCSISLKPTNYSFNFIVDEQIEDEFLKNNANTLDIFSIIWENILMEIPIKVVNEDLSDVKTEGNGWKFITNEEQRINPELEKLKDLL